MLRSKMAEVAKDCGTTAEGIVDVRLAVTEAATNAVIHAYAEAQGEVSVTAAMQNGELAIPIGDTGPGLVETRDSPGLGLGLALAVLVEGAGRFRAGLPHAPRTSRHLAAPLALAARCDFRRRILCGLLLRPGTSHGPAAEPVLVH